MDLKGDIKKRFAGDVTLGLLSLVIYHGVLQLLVYPLLSKKLGNDVYGEVLYYISLFSLTAAALGYSAENTRLVQRNRYKVSNGDCMVFYFGVISLLTLAVGGVLIYQKIKFSDIIAVLAIQALMSLRYYGEVAFKLIVNYKRYLACYTIVSAGYGVGLALFMVTGLWFLPFIVGESVGIVFSFMSSELKEQPFRPLANTKKFVQNATPLFFSYLLYQTVIALDRIILRNMLGAESVGAYYTATLIGKTAALAIAPFSGVLISYITHGDNKLNRSQFVKFLIISLGGGAAFYVLSIIGTPIFTKLFYAQYYDEVRSMTLLVNLGQVACFISTLILVVVLTFKNEKWQLAIQSVYFVVFLVSAIILVKRYGVNGMAIATAVANCLRLILTIAVGMSKGKNKTPELQPAQS